METTAEEFFDFWYGEARRGFRCLGASLKREYEHRQRRWVQQVLQCASAREWEMARGRKPQVEVQDGKGMPVFINCQMASTERPKVTKFGENADKIWGLVEQLLNDGYKLSWSFDRSRGAYVASLTCKAVDDDNFNQTLSAWSSGWYDALVAVLYKHFVYLSAVWANALTVKSEDAFG